MTISPSLTLVQGHVLEVLKEMPSESVHCVVTSPPYWGPRDYKIEPVVWEGQKGCEHEWISDIKPDDAGQGHYTSRTRWQHIAKEAQEKGIAVRDGDGMNKNSALFWLPKISPVLPMPRTEIVLFDYREALSFLDGQEAKNFPWIEIEAAAEHIGWPVFIRTDLASAKHQGPRAYQAQGQEDLSRIIWLTIEDYTMKDLEPEAFLVREFLHLVAPFAAFGGLPIANEWRIFAEDGELECSHFYWPEEAIKFWHGIKAPPEWRQMLKALADVAPTPPCLEGSKIASKICGGAWSIDWAQTLKGEWVLIDMALSEVSWHPKHG